MRFRLFARDARARGSDDTEYDTFTIQGYILSSTYRLLAELNPPPPPPAVIHRLPGFLPRDLLHPLTRLLEFATSPLDLDSQTLQNHNGPIDLLLRILVLLHYHSLVI